MDRVGYVQPSNALDGSETMRPADLSKWSTANRDIWKLVKITGASVAQAKEIVIGRWDMAEKTRFEAWVRFFESEDDKKYVSAYSDCDFDTVKTAALRAADTIGGERGRIFSDRISSTENVRTVIDCARAMASDPSLTKVAEEERPTKMFTIIRDVQDELSKKKLVRNLARVLSMDRDGMFPEVPQALAKLIEAYGYATTRIQDVMGRLGLQLSMSQKPEKDEEEEDKLSKAIKVPDEVRKPEPRSKPDPHSSVTLKKERPIREEDDDDGSTVLPRIENRGV